MTDTEWYISLPYTTFISLTRVKFGHSVTVINRLLKTFVSVHILHMYTSKQDRIKKMKNVPEGFHRLSVFLRVY